MAYKITLTSDGECFTYGHPSYEDILGTVETALQKLTEEGAGWAVHDDYDKNIRSFGLVLAVLLSNVRDEDPASRREAIKKAVEYLLMGLGPDSLKVLKESVKLREEFDQYMREKRG